jgi:hypothetical protein
MVPIVSPLHLGLIHPEPFLAATVVNSGRREAHLVMSSIINGIAGFQNSCFLQKVGTPDLDVMVI